VQSIQPFIADESLNRAGGRSANLSPCEHSRYSLLHKELGISFLPELPTRYCVKSSSCEKDVSSAMFLSKMVLAGEKKTDFPQ
jgi:hypothetical protein